MGTSFTEDDFRRFEQFESDVRLGHIEHADMIRSLIDEVRRLDREVTDWRKYANRNSLRVVGGDVRLIGDIGILNVEGGTVHLGDQGRRPPRPPEPPANDTILFGGF